MKLECMCACTCMSVYVRRHMHLDTEKIVLDMMFCNNSKGQGKELLCHFWSVGLRMMARCEGRTLLLSPRSPSYSRFKISRVENPVIRAPLGKSLSDTVLIL